MNDDILTYREMCDAEKVQTLQRGMNYRLNSYYSVILMSQRSNAPYRDKILDDGVTIEYEGHDSAKRAGIDPKIIDQPRFNNSGTPTQNGLFADTVDRHKSDNTHTELVRAYEKLFDGIWSDKGFFEIVDYKYVSDGVRKVFKFYLRVKDVENKRNITFKLKQRTRIIPTKIKKEVWVRDGGKCVICGANDELHFDHDLPYSKGGTSFTTDNVRILCARHNLQKSAKIE